MQPIISVASSTALVSGSITQYWDFLSANLNYVIPFVIALAVLSWGLAKVTHRKVFPRKG